MVLVYATTDDLEASPWLITDPPANVARLLASASSLVRAYTRSSLYDTDGTGAPSDTDVAAGFRDATCAQVSAWIAAGVTDADLSGAASSGVIASKSLGPRSITYAGAESAAADRRALVRTLTAEAIGYLDDLGLVSGLQVIG